MEKVQGIPISFIAKEIGLNTDIIRSRLKRRGIDPVLVIGTTGFYDESVIELIRETLPRGGARPHKKRAPALSEGKPAS
jgi:hypothetical protein